MRDGSGVADGVKAPVRASVTSLQQASPSGCLEISVALPNCTVRMPFPLTSAAVLATSVTVLLAGCGGGQGSDAAGAGAGVSAASVVTTDEAAAAESPAALTLSAEVASLTVSPTFHLAPVELAAPTDDSAMPAVQALQAVHTTVVPASARGIDTRGLSLQALREATRARALSASSGTAGTAAATTTTASPMASGTVIATYTPAQIRAAYGLPSLPASFTGLTAAQAASFGAGQTIYIVNAYHDPNITAELAAFNQKFALPGCTALSISTSAALPLAAPASTDGCSLAVVYGTATGTMTSKAPAYNAGWATEIALDVQWAHAIAPMARIVLIEAPDAGVGSLTGAITLANRMGAGVVSMSFGAEEGSWTASTDSVFGRGGMTYLAATGDSGVQICWPAVSANVLAVGGTTLTYGGNVARSEVAWSGSGGGVSAYTAKPSYQTAAVPGLGDVTRRAVPDVAFNADPRTGQYVAIIASGSTTASWVSAGGTSLSTPQWAGMIAVANAQRAVASKAGLGAPQSVLYGAIGTVPGNYASAFLDVTSGANGACSTCASTSGFDLVTGLGTPHSESMLALLVGNGLATTLSVSAASVSGTAGQALSYPVSYTALNAVSFTLSGSPKGMTISSKGVVAWAAPVAGSYAVTVTVKDTKTAQTRQAVLSITIAAPAAPTVTSASVSGQAGVALKFTPSYTAPHAVSFALSGAPKGMAISSAGLVSWASPVAGNYRVVVTVTDKTTRLSAKGTFTITIAAASTTSGLVLSASAMNGVAGRSLSGTVVVSAPGASRLTMSVSGAPAGMTFSLSGSTLKVSWARPVAGSHAFTLKVTDNLKRTSTLTVPVTIQAA